MALTPTKIPQPKYTPTKIVHARTKKCVICQKELGVVNPVTGKKEDNYVTIDKVDKLLTKLVQRRQEDVHPSNYICRGCERKVLKIETLHDKKIELSRDLLEKYREHADSLRKKRMTHESPPRKARKSLLGHIPPENQQQSSQPPTPFVSRQPKSNTPLMSLGVSPLEENATMDLERACKVS